MDFVAGFVSFDKIFSFLRREIEIYGRRLAHQDTQSFLIRREEPGVWACHFKKPMKGKKLNVKDRRKVEEAGEEKEGSQSLKKKTFLPGFAFKLHF